MEQFLMGEISRIEAGRTVDLDLQGQASDHVPVGALVGVRTNQDQDTEDDEGQEEKNEAKDADAKPSQEWEASDEEYFRTHKNPREAKPSAGNRSIKRTRETFPLKLYRILFEAEKNGQTDIISFGPNCQAFAVHKNKEFIRDIMPKYFGAGRMNTFLKQLNLYNFRRITEGPYKGSKYL
jgi:HSF-type DNA-binding